MNEKRSKDECQTDDVDEPQAYSQESQQKNKLISDSGKVRGTRSFTIKSNSDYLD